jgi:uncharacterized protein (DUF111 family)
MPEYDDCLRAAEATGIPVRLVYDEAMIQVAMMRNM